MIEIDTDFPYLGSRDYIHGTSILCGFLHALEGHGETEITVKRLKFQRPAQSNGRLLLTNEHFAEKDEQAANCAFLGTAGSTTWRGLFVEGAAAVSGREPVGYAITELDAKDFAGRCSIETRDRDDLIRTLVEANKRFHEAAVEPAAAAVRFGYLEGWSVPGADFQMRGRLEAKNLITRRTEDGYMTVNRLTYVDAKNGAASLTLCFNVVLSAQAA